MHSHQIPRAPRKRKNAKPAMIHLFTALDEMMAGLGLALSMDDNTRIQGRAILSQMGTMSDGHRLN
jgi:hypothetical protein